MSIDLDQSFFLDRNQEVRIHDNILPLWDQQNKLQFVTFRCIDSIPVSEREYFESIKKWYEVTYPKPWSDEIELQYNQKITERVETLLDNGYGKCLLKFPEYRIEVDRALRYFYEKRYFIIGYVIMPNHVHVLMYMLGDNLIEDSLKSIKKFSAVQINRKLGTRGHFWAGINYCRLIRNYEHYEKTRLYIAKNPENLKEGEYSLYFA